MTHPRIKEIIQDCNLNFLLGSGLSMPYLSTLGNIEMLLTDVERVQAPDAEKSLVRISLYKAFFDSALAGNLGILGEDAGSAAVRADYQNFLAEINNILLRRKSTILSKEVNLFTTNVDIFPECALDHLSLEVNDGFNGRFNPRYSLSNFNTSRYKKSLHFENVAELPVFNLLKLHGSLSWMLDDAGEITFSRDLALVNRVRILATPAVNAIAVEPGLTIEQLVERAAGLEPNADALAFMQAYERLPIVNPTKDKFRSTTLNQTYYELLRMYSNELEKENTVLFALGFSFADEHIREITLRSLNSNPTLILLIYAYDRAAKAEIEARFPSNLIKNRNLVVIEPPYEQAEGDAEPEPRYTHTLRNLNQHVFNAILPPIPDEEEVEHSPHAAS
jgi:hypothetical protein